MAYLLDTSVAIQLRDGDRLLRPRLLEIEETPSISAVTRVELEGGVYAHAGLAHKRRLAIDALLSEFVVLDFTDEIAGVYGAIVKQAGFSRRKIVDRMIAATALAHDLELVTLNARDFRDIHGLRLVAWNRST